MASSGRALGADSKKITIFANCNPYPVIMNKTEKQIAAAAARFAKRHEKGEINMNHHKHRQRLQ